MRAIAALVLTLTIAAACGSTTSTPTTTRATPAELVAASLSTTEAPTTTAPPTTVPPSAEVNRDLYAAWTKVAICEEGGWVGRSGDLYPNSLGITAANWYANGGGDDYSPAAQILVAERLRASIGMDIPDQNGCAAW